MDILMESMTLIHAGSYRIRVWRQETEFPFPPTFLLANIAYEYQEQPMNVLAERLLSEERVNAVEVLDGSAHGIVLYRDWP